MGDLVQVPSDGYVPCAYDGPAFVVNRLPGTLHTMEKFLNPNERPFKYSRTSFTGLEMTSISYPQLVATNCNAREWRASQLCSVYALNNLLAIEQDWFTADQVTEMIAEAMNIVRPMPNGNMHDIRNAVSTVNESLADVMVQSAILCQVPNGQDFKRIAMMQMRFLRGQAAARFAYIDNEAGFDQEAEDEGAEDEGDEAEA